MGGGCSAIRQFVCSPSNFSVSEATIVIRAFLGHHCWIIVHCARCCGGSGLSGLCRCVLLLFFLSRFLFFLTGKGTGRIFRLLVQFVDRNYRNYRVCIYSRSGTTFEWEGEDRDLKIYVGMYKKEFLSPLFFSLSLFLVTFSKEVITYPRIFEISIYILFPFLY